MSNIVRAWKDEVYRQSLSMEEQALLPANPIGEIELTEAELAAVSGALDGLGGSNSPFGEGTGDSRTQQVITFEPFFGGATLATFAPTAAQCNNLASPATSGATFPNIF